jgi:hypothetical protein
MPSTVSSDLISHQNTYAWLGTAGKSVSTLSRDGVEVRRNCDTNPGFEVDASGWSASGGTTTSYSWTGSADASSSRKVTNGTQVAANVIPNPSFRNGMTGYSVEPAISATKQADGSMRVITTNGMSQSFVITNVANNTDYTLVIVGRSFQGGTTAVYGGVPQGVQIPFTIDFGTYYVDITTATQGNLYLSVISPGENPTNGFDLKALMLVPGKGYRGEFFDGNTPATSQGVDVVRSTSVSHSGAASLQVRWQSPKRQGEFAAHSVTGLQDDTDYMVSLWVSIPKALSKPILLSVTDSGTQGPNAVTLQEATPGWQRIVFRYRTLVGSTGLSIWLYDPNSYTGSYLTQSVYIDDVLIETGSAELPYFDGSTGSYVEFENTQPLTVNGWGEGATGQNIVNPIIGGGVDVTLQAASLRQGSFELVYQDEDEAAFAFAMHQRPSTFTITDSERPSIAMTYVVDGRISRTLDDETRDYWLVRVEYQEV